VPEAGKPGEIDTYGLTLFFNIFVMLQFWNLFNARCLGLNQSAFTQLSRNRGFLLIAALILVGQIVMMQLGGKIFRTVPLSAGEWLLIIGGTSFVLWIGEAIRFFKRSGSKKAAQ
jgi:Ca2+-transporting ATPase